MTSMSHNGAGAGGAEELQRRITQARSKPENTAALLDDVRRFIDRFIVLAKPEQATALALWALHSHVFEASEATPYIIATSAERRSGKSHLKDALALIVARPWTIDGPPSEAVMFRTIDKRRPTILLDEADALWAGSSERTEPLRALLNAGFMVGATVPRCVGTDHDTRDFVVFCPKFIAGIDAGRWPDTIRDRSIIIELRRKLPSERIERFRRRDVKPEAESLRERSEKWGKDNIAALTGAWPYLPHELDDRAADAWEPLLAIAELAGGEWPERAQDAAIDLSGNRADDDSSIGTRLLADVAKVFEGKDALTTDALLGALNEMDDAPWGDWSPGRIDPALNSRDLSKLLKPYGIRPKTIRVGAKTPRGYEREAFADSFARYLGGRYALHLGAAGTSTTSATSKAESQVDVVDVGCCGFPGGEPQRPK